VTPTAGPPDLPAATGTPQEIEPSTDALVDPVPLLDQIPSNAVEKISPSLILEKVRQFDHAGLELMKLPVLGLRCRFAWSTIGNKRPTVGCQPDRSCHYPAVGTCAVFLEPSGNQRNFRRRWIIVYAWYPRKFKPDASCCYLEVKPYSGFIGLSKFFCILGRRRGVLRFSNKLQSTTAHATFHYWQRAIPFLVAEVSRGHCSCSRGHSQPCCGCGGRISCCQCRAETSRYGCEQARSMSTYRHTQNITDVFT
jgi:hypothetical protein